MNKFGWCAAWGLCLLQLSLAQIGKIDLNVTCRYAGVFHVEKNGRYSISRTEAADLCKAFDCTLPTMAQMEKAWQAGFETCRYGFIEGHVVIPRIHPNPICAANNTGVYILTSNTSQYDTYCYNASAPQGEDCTAITNLTNAFDGEVSISIVNRDGTRYTQKGEYRTNPDDINNTTADYDTSSGSYGERSTPESYIIHTHFPTAHPTQDQDSPGVSYYPEETPDTTATALMSTSGTTPKTTTKRREAEDWFSWLFQPSESKNHLHTTTVMAGTDSNTISAGWKPTEENEDERDKHPIHSGSGIDDDEDFISSTNMDSSHSTTLQPSADSNTHLAEDWDRTGPLPVTTHTKEYTTLIPVTPANTESPGVTEVTVDGDSNVNIDGPLPEDGDSSSDRSDHTTQRSGPTGHSSGSQEGDANTTSGPIRKPQIPEWLIILASLLALALILAVCIAVNSRRRCGQKKKLVINGNGAVEDRKPSGLNGEASKSQEMVHLVNKESSETPDQCMTADETRNLQNVDMKIGV
ncbi:CD44 antigen isoform X35 [Myotis myotis]|uniref:CD44 antigen isoform X35 n=1 Tax=Myotis myotis TaxID=51298 RepID=UPI00174D90B7|nr:CD44 antigen isoform X35 [Myotis myotis]